MKKLTLRRRRWFRMRQRRTLRRRRQLSGQPLSIGLVYGPDYVQAVFLPKPVMSLPAVMSLDENLDETLRYVGSLRQRLLRPPRSGLRSLRDRTEGFRKQRGAPKWIAPYVDFGNINTIDVSTALILAAEYDRARYLRALDAGRLGRLSVVNPQTWNQDVVTTLFNLGFFQLLGISDYVAADNPDAPKVVRFRAGQRNDPTEVDQLIQELEKMFDEVNLNPGDACFELAGALGEAMENVVHCAYPRSDGLPHPHVGRWWMTGSVDRKTRTMAIAIYDQGISIPGSLKGWKFYEGFTNRFKRLLGLAPDLNDPTYDGQVIKLAIEESTSSTGLSQHGKGLAHIQAFVDSCKSGRLRILSRCGKYEYTKGNQPVVESLETSVGGTLVEWQVTI
jgi:hypothetical protein